MGPAVLLLVLTPLAVLLVILLAALALALRHRVLQRRGGTFECCLRQQPRPDGKGWMLGVGRYTGDAVEWYRLFSYSPRPRRTVPRRSLSVVGRRPPLGPEAYTLLAGATVVECLDGGRRLELGMTDAALTGFLAWLEAAPPGEDVNVA